MTTDHKALEALQTSKRLTGRLARWALAVQHLSFTVAFKAGVTHQNADGLSIPLTIPSSRTSNFKGGGDVEDDLHKDPFVYLHACCTLCMSCHVNMFFITVPCSRSTLECCMHVCLPGAQ